MLQKESDTHILAQTGPVLTWAIHNNKPHALELAQTVFYLYNTGHVSPVVSGCHLYRFYAAQYIMRVFRAYKLTEEK